MRVLNRKTGLALAAAFVGMLAYSVQSQAGIVGSAHDFSVEPWTVNSEICVPCHTPHNGDTSIPGAPLWNHTQSTATYTVYSSSTLNAAPGQPSGISKLCLSCHDGSVAVDDFGGGAGTAGPITGAANFGTDLSNDHPISFTYNPALATADGELYNPDTTNSGLGGTITVDLLFSGSMECASCHDPHNTPGVVNMLRKSNTSSALCLTCHNK